MPRALPIAFCLSIGLHLALMFGSEIDLPNEPAPLPLVAELKPLPRPPVIAEPVLKPAPPPRAKPKKPRRKPAAVAPVVLATPVLSVPGEAPDGVPPANDPAAPAEQLPEPVLPVEPATLEPVAVVEPRLPPRGLIRYRIDRGESNFEIGVAHQAWEISDGHYRLNSVVETTGLVWLFKAIRIEMESLGSMTSDGLRPDSFVIRRDGRESFENATFDWERMRVRVGHRPEQALDEGAQDLLSFNFQLGFQSPLTSGTPLHLATGKKYANYVLDVVGDEEIEVPAGKLRTVHLRAPGANTTELWLAYDYLLLPVKIRQTDAKGGTFVQVATEIQLNQPSPP